MLFEKIKLEDDEQILLLTRRHWFVLALRLFGVFCVTLFPFLFLCIAMTIPHFSTLFAPLLEQYSSELLFLSCGWIILQWMTMAYIWTDYYLDLWVVTDRRIIFINQQRFFVRAIGSFRLERLQDINIEIPGFFATMFDYGTVEAETASGSNDEFRANFLPHPRDIKAIILEATDHRMKSSMQ